MDLREGKVRRWVRQMLVLVLSLALLGSGEGWQAAAMAQTAAINTTTVTDTIYRGDGTAASGTVLVSWPAFAAAAGESVPAGNKAVVIGANGVLSVALVPNAGSTPMGSYYTVVYHLDDGTVTREYWVVPVSQGAVKVSAIRSTVLPASVAMQTVSKNYVDTQIAQALTGHPLDSSPYVVKTGDTMTGPLVLPGDPTAPLQASDKNYVDTQTAALQAGLGQKVSTLPQAYADGGAAGGHATGREQSEWHGIREPIPDGRGQQRHCECGGEPGLCKRLQCGGGADVSADGVCAAGGRVAGWDACGRPAWGREIGNVYEPAERANAGGECGGDDQRNDDAADCGCGGEDGHYDRRRDGSGGRRERADGRVE